MAHLTLQFSTIEVCPTAVSFDDGSRVAHDMHIITVCYYKEVFEFGLEFGKGTVDAEAEEERTKAAALLASNGVNHLSKASSRFEENDA